jgi:hypothetical protein
VEPGERLWAPSRARLARWLRRDVMDRQFAHLVAGRVWAAVVRDGHGRRVFVVVAERVPAVRASGLWPAVREHEIGHFDEARWVAGQHGRESARLIAAIAAAVRVAARTADRGPATPIVCVRPSRDDDDRRPLVAGALDERRPGPVGWAPNLGRAARSTIRWAVGVLRNRGPPRPGSASGGAVP